MVTKEQIMQALKGVIDPEIGQNVVDLNMIKDVNIDDKMIVVKMVLTVSFCPLSGYLANEVKKKTTEFAEGREVVVVLLDEQWIPPKRFSR